METFGRAARDYPGRRRFSKRCRQRSPGNRRPPPRVVSHEILAITFRTTPPGREGLRRAPAGVAHPAAAPARVRKQAESWSWRRGAFTKRAIPQ